MTPQNIIYVPAIARNEFRCKVPLKNTRQMFVVNGKVQGGQSPFSLKIMDGERMEQMLQIITVRNSDFTAPLETSERFSFGENSSARILQCSHTFSLDEFRTDEQVSINLEAGSDVEFYVMQNEHNRSEHYSSYDITLGEGASLRMVFISLHGGVISNRIKVSLCGRHASCDLGGLYLTDSRQLMDNYIDLNHLVPECRSNQLFKGILDDEGVTKFFGRINVAQDSQKTEAFQANHNLLLSDRARAYTKPQLDICRRCQVQPRSHHRTAQRR